MSSLFYATLGPELAGRWKLNPEGHLEIHACDIEEARQITAHWFGYDAAATVTEHQLTGPREASCDRITRTVNRPRKG